MSLDSPRTSSVSPSTTPSERSPLTVSMRCCAAAANSPSSSTSPLTVTRRMASKRGATAETSPLTLFISSWIGRSARMLTSPDTPRMRMSPPVRSRTRSPETVRYSCAPWKPDAVTSALTPSNATSAWSGRVAVMETPTRALPVTRRRTMLPIPAPVFRGSLTSRRPSPCRTRYRRRSKSSSASSSLSARSSNWIRAVACVPWPARSSTSGLVTRSAKRPRAPMGCAISCVRT